MQAGHWASAGGPGTLNKSHAMITAGTNGFPGSNFSSEVSRRHLRSNRRRELVICACGATDDLTELMYFGDQAVRKYAWGGHIR
jgi:hypothetical protein